MSGLNVEIIGSLVATIVIAILVSLYRKMSTFKVTVNDQLKILEEKHSKRLELLLHPITEYRDIQNFSLDLIKALEEFEGEYSRAIIYRALPCALSSALSDIMPECGVETDEYFRRATSLMDEIVIQGDDVNGGAWDSTIFGKTGILTLDEATKNYVKRLYFDFKAPATSDLAIHRNFNEFGIILLGKTKGKGASQISEWLYGFLIFYSSNFDKFMGGFRFNNHRHIEPFEEIFKMKYNESDFHHTFSQLKEENSGFYEQFKTFYRDSGDC